MDDSNGQIGGGWLYKEKGAVCGPVSAAALIDKLFGGALDGETSIAPEFGEWRRLSEVPEFEAPLVRALKARAEEKERLDKQRVRRRLAMGRAAVLVSAATVFSAGGFIGGHVLAVTKPWADKTDWTKRRPDLVMLSVKPMAPLAPSPGTGDGAEGGTKADGDTAAGNDGARTGTGGKRASKQKIQYGKSDKREEKVAAASTSPPPTKEDPKDDLPSTDGAAPEYNAAGLPRALSQSQIMKVLATQRSGIVNCLAMEAKTNPNMPPVVTIEFVITQKGMASEFQVAERDLRNGPLNDCLKSKIMSLRWPQFFGENKSVTLPFNIKRK